MVCFGNKQRSFFRFWDGIQVPHFGLFCWLWGWQATADPDHHRRNSNTALALSLWGLWIPVCTRLVWALWGSLAGKGFILNVILPLLLSCWGFAFALGHGVSFFGGLQHSPVDTCSAAGYSLGDLSGEDEHTYFCSAIFQVRPHCS